MKTLEALEKFKSHHGKSGETFRIIEGWDEEKTITENAKHLGIPYRRAFYFLKRYHLESPLVVAGKVIPVSWLKKARSINNGNGHSVPKHGVEEKAILAYRKQGWSYAAIADTCKVSIATIYHVLKEHGLVSAYERN